MAEEVSGKYKPLGEFLANLSEDSVTLSLAQIEGMVGRLPSDSASHQFWANTNHHMYRRGQWLENGFNAFYQGQEGAVRFIRTSADAEEPGSGWSIVELRGCVAMYRKMWDLQQSQHEVRKSEWRSEALGSFLAGRTAGAFEYRMQNISEIIRKLGIVPLQGYLPAKNIGPRIETILIGLISEFWDTAPLVGVPTDDPEELEARVGAARARLGENSSSPLPQGSDSPGKKERIQATFFRLASVIAYVENEAGGRCEACESEAPFLRENGTPFLEVHHVIHLADGGPDRIDNAVALCPNCHRRLHYGSDRRAIRNALYKNVARLKKPGQAN